MKKQHTIEYAQLAQQCYGIFEGEPFSPPHLSNWNFIAKSKCSHDTCYSFFVNDERKEIILGIRGTDLSSPKNIATDMNLLKKKISGNDQSPIGAEELAEKLAFSWEYFNGTDHGKEIEKIDHKEKKWWKTRIFLLNW